MKQFDVQRVESLMRYAEFLKDMNGAGVGDKGKKINRVIEMIHEEVGGYVDPVNITRMHGDGIKVEEVGSLHPDVERYIHQEVMKQMKKSIEAKDYVEQFMNTDRGREVSD